MTKHIMLKCWWQTHNCLHIFVKAVKRRSFHLNLVLQCRTRCYQTAGLTLLLFLSDLSDGCSDNLPLLVLAGSTELHTHTHTKFSVHTEHANIINIFLNFFLLLLTIFVSSSMSWIDCSFCDRTSNFSPDSDLRERETVKWSLWCHQPWNVTKYIYSSTAFKYSFEALNIVFPFSASLFFHCSTFGRYVLYFYSATFIHNFSY